ncbi:MAG: NAD-dependent epimerase/dehydratase family protein [Lachnospiraceae bacterium]|nr:NAD-dependent epimerase/dehydratase family protein [Lachnospiraceae bacterium]
MKYVVLGAAGFIGTNLSKALSTNADDKVVAIDEKAEYFDKCLYTDNIERIAVDYKNIESYESALIDADIVFHLISTNNPSSSNIHISEDITENVSISISVLEACVRQKAKRVLFLSSGGTVYGDRDRYPIKEEDETFPITTYGIQKLTIEKLFYLYGYIHDLNYVIVRLSNPYGPYQRPNGRLGALSTFTYRALKDEEIIVYGDGSVIRDYIYIDDAIEAIINIAKRENTDRIYNIGSGKGTSINELISWIGSALDKPLSVKYQEKRQVDLKENVLDPKKYTDQFGKLCQTPLDEGIRLTADFLKKYYDL